MRNHRQGEGNGQMLQRIVALLFALADLAELASHRRHAVRQLVLWLLYPAEAVARRLVLEVCGPCELAAPRRLFSSDSADDALRLAACLRMLAMMLNAVEAEAFLEAAADWPDSLPNLPACYAWAFKAVARPFPDTS